MKGKDKMKIEKNATITITREEKDKLDEAVFLIHQICDSSESGTCGNCPISELCGSFNGMRLDCIEEHFGITINVEE